ncbi:MAG: glycosyltransferase family 2 protein [Methanobrevibacter sp.]|uniref:glycosyltransferase family 2 protein n=1 Tax=Methanobrevibacter sp. TaxID=66852 RepID=UPI0026DF98A5|nr:glycosyltransferase family 2 protein [Methanobrevibacter sp.]MDO5848667.1 glycosyltransferase family 2 protein [Methanobrevibacter sp.]
MSLELKKGVSVVVPTYKGENHISVLLDSLKEQTLENDLFEVIFVVNGPEDETPNIIKKFQKENPDFNIVLTKSEKGAAYARNKGIFEAKREYITFVDDDDRITPNYLKKFFEKAKPNRVVIGTFLDIDEDTGEVKESYISGPLLKRSGMINDAYSTLTSALVIMTAKLIPSNAVKDNLFNPVLSNGEDVAFYSSLYAKNDFEFYLLDKSEDAVYYRLLRSDSVSRQDITYEFNIKDRLKVIKELNKSLRIAKNPKVKIMIRNLITSQVLWMNKYLFEYPEDLERVMYAVDKQDFDYFPYKYINEDPTQLNKPNSELIISYAFAPTSTTSSNVIAKKILLNKRNVSVICGTLDDEPKDELLGRIVDEFVTDKMKIDIDDYFFYSDGKKFVKKGLEILNKKPTYEKIYSRAQFIPSHLLGFFYKATHDTYWTAEFSDPVIYTLEGKYMSNSINDEELVEKINKALPDGFDKVKITDTVNEIVEYITFILADEIIFTNENQREIMLEDFPKLKEMVYNKSKVSRHPTLEKKYYYLRNSDYEIDKNYINFAYFGVVYGSRSFEEFMAGFNHLNEEFKDNFRLHIFTPNSLMFEQILTPEILEKTKINPPVEYFEFLNLTTKMDILLVEDASTNGIYDINPFLPSKISDYKGSGNDIWAICEKGSIMNGMENIKYKSNIKDFNSSKMAINHIMADKLGVAVKVEELNEYEIIKYYQERHAHLLNKMVGLARTVETLTPKQRFYERRIQEYREYTNYLRKWMRPRFMFKLLKKFRDYFRKFKGLLKRAKNN